jgi:hypothetical protein
MFFPISCSRKGFQKAVVRLPHIVKRKAGRINETSDVEYENFEGQFSVAEECSKRLVEESKKYKESIKQMLEGHEELIEAFKQILFSSEQQSNTNSAIEWNKLGEYIDHLSICKLELMNKLSVCIEAQLHKPMTSLAAYAKKIRAKCLKRDHKLIDYDRHRLELEKLRKASHQSTFSLSDEKKLIKREKEFEQANSDYQSINSLLKQELPMFCALAKKLVTPAIVAVIHFQQALVKKNLELCQVFCAANTTSKTSILRDYEKKKAIYMEIMQQCELFSSRTECLSKMRACSIGEAEKEVQQMKSPMQEKGEFVVAVYDYEASESGDLSFLENERIKVLEKNDDGWWKGALRGNVGMFPSKNSFFTYLFDFRQLRETSADLTHHQPLAKDNSTYNAPNHNQNKHCPKDDFSPSLLPPNRISHFPNALFRVHFCAIYIGLDVVDDKVLGLDQGLNIYKQLLQILQ